MQITINGTPYEVPDQPERPLLWVIRDELGLTGTKIGCAAGHCGACTIHVDGEARRACQTPLSAAQGAQIRTIEGLAERADDGSLRLHPVQQAFLEGQVPQCSWCMSGQMMAAAALLERTPAPSDDQIVAALERNYCRCGCYARITGAVRSAAELLARQQAGEA